MSGEGHGHGIDGDAATTPVVRARTILAACHEAWVTHRALGTPAVPLAVVDVGGTPHLVLGPGQVVPTGTVEVRLTAAADRIGSLTIDGDLEPSRHGMTDDAVWTVLREHESCLTEAGRSWSLSRVQVMPVRAARVRVSDPGATDGVQRPVGAADFLVAAVDAWALHGAEMVEHLEQHHQAELRELVRRLAGVTATAIVVTSLHRGGGVLTALSRDGLRDVTVVFAPAAVSPQHGLARLRAHAVRGREGVP
jgi:hypothetical protein